MFFVRPSFRHLVLCHDFRRPIISAVVRNLFGGKTFTQKAQRPLIEIRRFCIGLSDVVAYVLLKTYVLADDG